MFHFHLPLKKHARTMTCNLQCNLYPTTRLSRYLWAAVAKLDADWLDGTVTAAILTHPRRQWAARPLGVDTTASIMAWGGLAVVALAPVGLLANARPVRVVSQVALLGFHAANTALFGVSGIGCFSLVMVVSLVLFPCGIVGLESSKHQPVVSPMSTLATLTTGALSSAGSTRVHANQTQRGRDRGGKIDVCVSANKGCIDSNNDGEARDNDGIDGGARGTLQPRAVDQPSGGMTRGSGGSPRSASPPLPTAVLALLVLQAILPARQFSDGAASSPGWGKRHDRWAWRMKATVERMTVRVPSGHDRNSRSSGDAVGSGSDHEVDGRESRRYNSGSTSSSSSSRHNIRSNIRSGTGSSDDDNDDDEIGTIVVALCDVTVGHRRLFLTELNPSQREEVCARPAAAEQ